VEIKALKYALVCEDSQVWIVFGRNLNVSRIIFLRKGLGKRIFIFVNFHLINIKKTFVYFKIFNVEKYKI